MEKERLREKKSPYTLDLKSLNQEFGRKGAWLEEKYSKKRIEKNIRGGEGERRLREEWPRRGSSEKGGRSEKKDQAIPLNDIRRTENVGRSRKKVFFRRYRRVVESPSLERETGKKEKQPNPIRTATKRSAEGERKNRGQKKHTDPLFAEEDGEKCPKGGGTEEKEKK